jgi:hypothetical protein
MILRAMQAVAYATGRASHTRQVKGHDPDRTGYPGPPVCWLGVRLTTPPLKNKNVTKTQERRPRPTAGCGADVDDDDDDDSDDNNEYSSLFNERGSIQSVRLKRFQLAVILYAMFVL